MTMNIGPRIVLGFTLVVMLMTGLALYQFVALSKLLDRSDEIIESNIAATELLGRISTAQRDMRAHSERAVSLRLMADAGLGSQSPMVAQERWNLSRGEALGLIDRLVALALARAAVTPVAANVQRWQTTASDAEEVRTRLEQGAQVVQRLFEVINAGQVGGLGDLLVVLDERRALLDRAMETLHGHADEMAVIAAAGVHQIHASTRSIFIAALIVTLLVTLATIRLLHRSIAPRLTELVRFVEQVGRGDLTRQVRDFGPDETGRLGRQINQMIGSLANATRQTVAAVTNVGSATAQLEASVAQQAASTSQQSAAVQEITTTLSEIARSGSQITERAKEVAAASELTLGASKEGLQAVDETGAIMGRIGEQSETVAANILALTEKTRWISDIIATVNDIAERSDLLALNAAIEAASAGDQGKSFAVVADEMKNLAGQAKEATVQVQALLGDIQQGITASVMQTEESVKRSESGKAQVGRLRGSIERLVDSIEVNVQAFEQIIAGTNQQQIGVEQVAQAIQEIGSASNEVAISTRGLQGAAASLNALTVQLQSSVKGFVVA